MTKKTFKLTSGDVEVTIKMDKRSVSIMEHDVYSAEAWLQDLVNKVNAKVGKCAKRLADATIKKAVEDGTLNELPPGGVDAIVNYALSQPGYQDRTTRDPDPMYPKES